MRTETSYLNLIALILVITFLLTSVACAKPSATDSPATSTDSGPVTYHFCGDTLIADQGYVFRFESNGDVTLVPDGFYFGYSAHTNFWGVTTPACGYGVHGFEVVSE